MGNKLIVTLRKSSIGRPETQRRTLRGLGLTKLNKSVTLNNTPAIRGMIKKVIHMVEVQEVNNNTV